MQTIQHFTILNTSEVFEFIDWLNENKDRLSRFMVEFPGDGHSIVPNSVLIDELGFPRRMVEGLSRRYSSGTGKQQIFCGNEPVDFFDGVYLLNFVQTICDWLNITYESKLGRGSQARACQEALSTWINAAN